MAREYVPIFFEWLDVTQDLTAEEKGNLIDAVVSYASGREYEHLLCGACKIAFRFLKGQVDRNAAISDIRRQARQGKTQQTTTNYNKPEQTGSNFPKEKEKEKEKEKDKKEKFTPPTVEQVAAYCRERGNNIDAEYFVAYNENRNWTLSTGRKMKDWRLAVVTWEKNSFSKPQAAGKGATKPVNAQQYGQRDYTGVQAELMRQQDEEMQEFLKKGAV